MVYEKHPVPPILNSPIPTPHHIPENSLQSTAFKRCDKIIDTVKRGGGKS